jgi:hypothetical protein
MSAFYGRHKLWLWVAAWLLTRGLMVSQVGFLNHVTGAAVEDASLYRDWSGVLAGDHVLPSGELWQYPPGAAFLLLLPRLGLGIEGFGASFVTTMLAFDFVAFALIAWLGRREGRDTGVWIWLLAMPMLRAVPLLRFDLVGTAFAIAALVVIHRRPAWFGALAGLGAMVKVWPIVVLFGEWDWRRLLRACAAAAAAIALVFALSAIFFSSDGFEFLSEQGGRGLQVESVASLPWHLRQAITGEAPHVAARFGAAEIVSHPADVIAGLLEWAALAVMTAAAAWWLARSRAIRAGREDLADAAVSRDFVFTLVLLLVITSRVLSPQYMVWLFGLAAVALCAERSRIARPAWIVIGAAVLSTAAYGPYGAWGTAPVYGSAFNMVIRNLALLVAAVDASATMAMLLRPRAAAVAAPRTPARADGLGEPLHSASER